jgi:hypothetical protein
METNQQKQLAKNHKIEKHEAVLNPTGLTVASRLRR